MTEISSTQELNIKARIQVISGDIARIQADLDALAIGGESLTSDEADDLLISLTRAGFEIEDAAKITRRIRFAKL